MKPSLNDAYFRIKRAREHVNSIRRMQRRLTIEPDTITVESHLETEKIFPDPRWAVRFGETIYNLRAALDYLVYSLARLDSGHEKNGTQFPICSSPDKFEERVKGGWLRGVKRAHRTAIEALQPYPGRHGLDSQWLARFANFSNPDKHRHPTIVDTRTRTFTAWRISGTPIKSVNVNFSASRYISLGDADKTPLIPTLDSLRTHVSETLDEFASCFEGKCPH